MAQSGKHGVVLALLAVPSARGFSSRSIFAFSHLHLVFSGSSYY